MTATTTIPASADLFEKFQGMKLKETVEGMRRETLMPFYNNVESAVGASALMEGEPRLMFGSGNYLGLADDERVRRAAKQAIDDYGSTPSGSRLLGGTIELHAELERRLADWLGTDDTVVFTSAFQANVGCLGAILAPEDTAIVDSAAHASLMDGCALSGVKLRYFKHGRVRQLERELEEETALGRRVLVLVDGVYSMLGDAADLEPVVELCERHGARLLVDEAHAVGALGARGAGTAEALDLEDRVDIRTGALSKALAATGGFVAGPQEVVDFLRWNARTIIFTTSGVTASVGAAIAALEICASPEGAERRAVLERNARRFTAGLLECGYRILPELRPGREPTPAQRMVTPIVPVLTRDDALTNLMWRELYMRGVYVNAVAYPAVPKGKAILRCSVTAAHTDADVDRAVDAFHEAKKSIEAWNGPLYS